MSIGETTGPRTSDSSHMLSSMPPGFDIVAVYKKLLRDDQDITMPVAAIEALVELLSVSKAGTISEYMDILQQGGNELRRNIENNISLSAGIDLFHKFVSRSLADLENFEQCKAHLVTNGKLFIERAKDGRRRIAHIGSDFIKDESTILTHGYSRSILALVLHAIEESKRFKILVTESRPSGTGVVMAEILQDAGVPCCIILDAAVGYAMEKADMVLVGAEGVVENGGLINQIGTYQIAALAKIHHKPFYAVAESHKFVRLYPLCQSDLPLSKNFLKFQHESNGDPKSRPISTDISNNNIMTEEQLSNNPTLDFTPPEFIKALITDLGIMDPMSGVSEELMRLHL